MSSQEPPKKKSKQVENKQGTLLSWIKPCTSDPEPDVVEKTIQIKEQPGNENDLEPSSTIADRQEATRRQLSPPDQVFVMQCIATRFEQEDFKICVNIQELLLASFTTELAKVVKMYSEYLDSFKLKGQLLLLPQTAESVGLDTS